MTESEFRNALAASNLAYKDELLALARPAIHVLATPAEEFEVGASRLGGLPDLPPSVEWPTWVSVPQQFVAQINLAELPDVGERRFLPKTGHLYFFFEPKRGFAMDLPGNKGWAVIYSADPPVASTLREAPNAFLVEQPKARFKLSFSEMWSVPVGSSVRCDPEMKRDWDDVRKFVKDFYRQHNINMAFMHQMFGYSDWLGYGTADEEQCEKVRRGIVRHKLPPEELKAEINEAAKRWLVLLKINDEGDRGGIKYMDVGAIFYWIRLDELMNQDFSQTCATMVTH